MSKVVIQIEVKNVYGVTKAYPFNEAAKVLAEIAGTKTLSTDVLAKAVRLGMYIEQVAQVQFMGEAA